jgi:ParB/RepB/Spo0J family partition protein
MLQLSTAGELRQLDLKSISLSPSRSQIERRNHFNKGALDDLTANIKQQGVVVPIIVRPMKPFDILPDAEPYTTWSIWRNGGSRKKDGDPVVARCATRDEAEQKLLELVADSDTFELIAGERRLLAARKAGLAQIPAIVRLATDSQAHEIQLIENLQREDLTELAEAEGYEALLKRGMSAEEIADKVAKSRSHVYARMKLIALSETCRAAFYDGKINASVALLLARIPVHELQDKALAKITELDPYHKEPMSFRDAQDYLRDEFTLKLSGAPFPRDDVDLVKTAGACGPCPKRTGNQPADLFGDIKSADVCTDPTCFKEKRIAFQKRELERAKETGTEVISARQASGIIPKNRGYMSSYSSDGSHKHLQKGYARPSDKCLEDPKKRTWAELAGKDAPSVLIQDPDSSRTFKAFRIADIKDRIEAKGVKLDKPAKDKPEQRERDQAKAAAARELDGKVRSAVFREIYKAAPAKLDRSVLEQLLQLWIDRGDIRLEDLFESLGWPLPKGGLNWGNRIKLFATQLEKLSDADLNRLVFCWIVIEDAFDDYGDRKGLAAVIKQLKIDEKKIRAGIETANAPKDPPKAEQLTAATKPTGKKAKAQKAAKKK